MMKRTVANFMTLQWKKQSASENDRSLLVHTETWVLKTILRLRLRYIPNKNWIPFWRTHIVVGNIWNRLSFVQCARVSHCFSFPRASIYSGTKTPRVQRLSFSSRTGRPVSCWSRERRVVQTLRKSHDLTSADTLRTKLRNSRMDKNRRRKFINSRQIVSQSILISKTH